MAQKELIDHKALDIILNRLCCELIEIHHQFEQTVLIGLQPRGVAFAEKLKSLLETKFGIPQIQLGSLDITFFRDDFRRRDQPIKANQTKIDFLVEDKHVVFVDDVLFTGRSVRAALDAIHSFGRPKSIELLVLVDRRFSRDLPIQPDYKGSQVDSLASEHVAVDWGENGGVYLISEANE